MTPRVGKGKKFQPVRGEETCAFSVEDKDYHRIRDHAYPYRCSLPPDHAGRLSGRVNSQNINEHKLRPAFRVLWEIENGVPLSKRHVVQPLDGDWTNISVDNLELTNRSKLAFERQETIRNQLKQTKRKRCTQCGAYLLLAEFPPNRNVCLDCSRLATRRTRRSAETTSKKTTVTS